jgi:predicted GNAT family N-acyltransferase
MAVTHIRSATIDDATALAEMRWEFRAGRQAPTEPHDAFVTRCADWMRTELARGSWHAWVAEQDGLIVGQAWMLTIEKMPNPVSERSRHAYVSNLYVTPAARGGAGTPLLEAAIAAAEAEEVDRIVLWPSPLSKTLYLRHGFTPNGDVFERTCG